MDPGAIFLLLAVILLAALFVTQPFLKSRRMRVVSGAEHELSTLMAERDRLITTLQELDFDHTLGKIPTEDYADMRARLVQHAAEVLRKLDALQADQSAPALAGAERIEAAIAARRAGTLAQKSAPSETDKLQADDELEALIASRKAGRKEKSAGFCARCGKAVLRSDRFCPHCGKPIN